MNEDTNQAVDQMANQIADSSSTTAPTFGLGSNPTDNNNGNAQADNQQPNPTFTPMDDKPKTDSSSNLTSSGTTGNADTSKPLDSSSSSNIGELGEIKKEALSKLAPIVGKLDQTPEEKYRTLMLLIQSSDDRSLIKSAYQAASEIKDDAKKAEALLGIVNEIEYFSQADQKD